MPRAILILVILYITLAYSIPQIQATGTGYLAIKDYLGTTWSVKDIQKIINYYYETNDGETKSLADYFWIIIDNDFKNEKYSLKDFIASPLDGETAVLPLPLGDHTIDIYWFGYHQRQLVHIVENQHYVLKLETAPVVPFETAGEPPKSAEWDLAANPEGLTIQRRDGKAWVRFNNNTSYITVAWYDEDTGWNYHTLDIYVDTGYQYNWFHITNPENPTYYYEKTGSFLFLPPWDVYRVKELVKWNRTGEIMHVSYIVAIAENEGLLKGAWEFWDATGKTIVANAMQFIDPVSYTIIRINAFIEYVQSAYDTYMAELYSSRHMKSVLLVWDVFVTPTQVVVTAHAYDINSNGNVVKKSITSPNAFTINDRLVYVKQLSGGVEYNYVKGLTGPLTTRTNSYSGSSIYTYVSCSYKLNIGGIRGYDENNPHINMPCGKYFKFYVDDLSKYEFNIFIAFRHRINYEWNTNSGLPMDYAYTKYNLQIQIVFNDSSKADLFEQRLLSNNIQYTRNGNSFAVTVTSNAEKQMPWNSGGSGKWVDEALYFDGLSSMGIDRLIPSNSSGYFSYRITGYLRVYDRGYVTGTYDETEYYIDNFRLRIIVTPKMTPPQISLLKDGYQVINGAFAVQVYTALFREDADAYMLGYYLLGNDPPPSFIIRDVHPDIENDLMHYVWTIITADAYGQDLVTLTSKYNETIHVLEWYMALKPTVKTYDGVIITLFNYNRMAFLNLAPEVIEHLLAIPPSQGGYGTPVIDWSTISLYTVNFTRPYELYYYDKPSGLWIRVKPIYYNDTRIYDIVRYADNLLVETLKPGDTSQYYYKLIYMDTNQTLKGWLYNDNGTLKFITGQVIWTVTPEELKKILQEIQLKGIYDRWLEQWNKLTDQLGLIGGFFNNLWDWWNKNWKWIVLGLAGFLLLLVLLARGSGKVVVKGRFR